MKRITQFSNSIIMCIIYSVTETKKKEKMNALCEINMSINNNRVKKLQKKMNRRECTLWII